MSDERFYIENDAYDEPTIWRIGAGPGVDDDAPVLRRSDVCAAVTS